MGSLHHSQGPVSTSQPLFPPLALTLRLFRPPTPEGKTQLVANTDFSLSPFADIHPSMLMRKQLLVWSFSTDKTRPPAEISRWGVGWDEQLLIIQTTGIKQRVPPHCSAHRLILNLIYCLTSMNITFSAGCDSSHSRSTVFFWREQIIILEAPSFYLSTSPLSWLWKQYFKNDKTADVRGLPIPRTNLESFHTPPVSEGRDLQ